MLPNFHDIHFDNHPHNAQPMCINRAAVHRIPFRGIFCPRFHVEQLNAEDTSGMSRRLDICEECVVAMVLVCEAAVPSVCALAGFGPPISDVADAAISTLCETFRAACSDSRATEACAVQCEDSDDNDSSTGKSICSFPVWGFSVLTVLTATCTQYMEAFSRGNPVLCIVYTTRRVCPGSS